MRYLAATGVNVIQLNLEGDQPSRFLPDSTVRRMTSEYQVVRSNETSGTFLMRKTSAR
jgi:hypothetical protein